MAPTKPNKSAKRAPSPSRAKSAPTKQKADHSTSSRGKEPMVQVSGSDSDDCPGGTPKVNTRCFPKRFHKLWEETIVHGVDDNIRGIINAGPFRHLFFFMPDIDLQRGFLTGLMNRYNLSTGSIEVGNKVIRPTGEDMALILGLRHTGTVMDVGPRRPGEGSTALRRISSRMQRASATRK